MNILNKELMRKDTENNGHKADSKPL